MNKSQVMETLLNKALEVSGDSFSFVVEAIEEAARVIPGLNLEYCDNCECFRVDKGIYECESAKTTTGYICEDCYTSLADIEEDY